MKVSQTVLFLADVALRPPVVEQRRVAVHLVEQTDAPQGCGSPLAAGGAIHRPVVSKARAHVVQQHVGERVDDEIIESAIRGTWPEPPAADGCVGTEA